MSDNYATGPNPAHFCMIAGFESMRHFMPSRAAVVPPPAVLSLVLPRVLVRENGEELCIIKAIELYESAEGSNVA